MSNSDLVTYINLTNKHSGLRTYPITKIAIHHMAGRMTAKQCADYFVRTDREVSSNYTIGWDGSIALNVEEKNRAWTTSSPWCDQRAVTIEVSNAHNNGGNWEVTSAAYNSLLDLVTDICKRNNIKSCTYTGGKDGVLQKHEWYANTNCPGKWLGSRFPEISRIVNDRLNGKAEIKINNSNAKYYLQNSTPIFINSNDAKNNKNSKGVYHAGTYYLYKTYAGMLNITKRAGVAGAWINPKLSISKAKVTPKRKTISQLADEVIDGAWGNGSTRRKLLEKNGYDYYAVQKEVNRKLGY